MRARRWIAVSCSLLAACAAHPKPVTVPALREAAVARYNVFFGYAKNIFLGDSRENSSIQANLDRGHPEMAGEELEEHVARIKRSFALDDSFNPRRGE